MPGTIVSRELWSRSLFLARPLALAMSKSVSTRCLIHECRSDTMSEHQSSMAVALQIEPKLIGKLILGFVVKVSDVGLSSGRVVLHKMADAAMFRRASDISCFLRVSMTRLSITSSSMDPGSTSESSIPPHGTVPGLSHYTGQNDLASRSLAGFFGSIQGSEVNAGPSSHPPHPYTHSHGKPL